MLHLVEKYAPFHRPGLKCVKKKGKKTALFFVPLVPGFSTASYLKVHIKTHHGSPLPTIHTFPEPRGELQMHNGNPFHMGRQCLVEGKRPLVPFRTFMFLAFHLLCCFLERKKKKHMLPLLSLKWSISASAATCLHTHSAICWLSTCCQ